MRRTLLTLFRSGNATSPTLSNIRTVLTHTRCVSFDYPVYEKLGKIIVSPVAYATGIPNLPPLDNDD